MERQLLIILTVILITAGCQQLPVNIPNTNETSYDIPTDDPNSNLYTSNKAGYAAEYSAPAYYSRCLLSNAKSSLLW